MSTSKEIIDDAEYTEEEIEEEVEEEVEEEEVVEEEMGGSGGEGGGHDTPSVAKHTPSPSEMSVGQGPPGKGKGSAAVVVSKKGKVVPSEAVKTMKMSSPESLTAAGKDAITPTKDPFTSFGKWNQYNISQIKIRFPDLTSKNETTSAQTRENKAEARYWRGTIDFTYASFHSETLRFSNVPIPYMHGVRNYGSSFVYIALPPEVGAAFLAAGKTKRPTVIGENRVIYDSKRWWKALNGIEGSFGSIDARTKKFKPVSLDELFQMTGKGIIANLVLTFLCKAGTEDREPLKPSRPCKVVVELVRGYIVKSDVDVEPPSRTSFQKKKVEPLATSEDIATDDLSRRLAELGL